MSIPCEPRNRTSPGCKPTSGRDPKLRIALLVDNLSLSKWQEDALSEISDLAEVVLVLNCRNTSIARSIFRHGAYYLLNLVSIKSALTRKRRVDFGRHSVVDFDSRYEGAWQWVPDEVVAAVAKSGVHVVVKFGMSLLRMDNLAGIDVLSFHHGDPRLYRGRPAGFYELMQGSGSVGLMVQKLSNLLDGGEVVALGHAKAYGWSYRKTVQGLYRSSPGLLRLALINYIAGARVRINAEGKNYRLPSNLLVIKFCACMLARKIKRLLYGAFWEKRWNIAVYDNFVFQETASLAVSAARSAPIPAKYNFFADAFFSADGSAIRAEALVARTGRGEIVELDEASLKVSRTLLAGPHFSYPYTFVDDGHEFVLPEVASHHAPYLLRVSGEPRMTPLVGLEHLRLVDPSMIKIDGLYYLFCGHPSSATDMLHLYIAKSFRGPFTPHHKNPIVIDPSCARMGGGFLVREGKLFRFGQDNSGSYGDGIRVMEIERISPYVYKETEVWKLRFKDANGPHTIDIREKRAVLDYYFERFSLLAGYRRIVANIHARSRQSRSEKSALQENDSQGVNI